MHAEAIGFARSPMVVVGYLGVAALLFGCMRREPAMAAASADVATEAA